MIAMLCTMNITEYNAIILNETHSFIFFHSKGFAQSIHSLLF
jgi:hypothetical protein